MKAPGKLPKIIQALFIQTLLSIPLLISGQAVGDYRTNATGSWNWNTTANWQRWNGSAWVGAASYPGQNAGAGTVNILDNTTVEVAANVPNSIGALNINGGGNDSYVTFTGAFSLTVTGQTYLNSNNNNDEKSVLVDAGTFTTGSVSANSSGDSRDAYIRISTGSVTVTGNISLNASSLRTYILFTGDGSLYAGGSISGGNITSTPNGGNNAPTSGTVIFNGTSSQALGNYTYYNMTVNNSAGVTLPGNITVNNTLTMTQGNINAGANTLSVGGTLAYTAGTMIGRLQRTLTATGTEFLFPVGTASSYNPLKLSFTNLTAGTLTVRYQAADIGTSGLPLDDSGNWIHDRYTTGYWTLTAGTLASTDYSVKLNYNGFTGIDSYSRILKRTNGGNLAIQGTHDNVSGTEISRSGLNGISTTATDLAIGRSYVRITTQPSDVMGCGNPSFSVVASGTAPLTYRWQQDNGGGFVNLSDGGIYSGTTTATLTLTGAPGSMNGYRYRCLVTAASTYTATSNAATYTVAVLTFGYQYYMNVTLDQASGTADLTDFPALVSFTSALLRTTANGGHVSNASGYDIIFTDQSGNKLDHEIEYYNASTGQYTAWVRIPVLSCTSTTSIRILYGNPSVTTNPSLTSVWVSSYKGVWHLNGTGFTDDATTNLNNGTNSATTDVTGRIAGGRGFNGTTSYIMTPSNGFVDNDNNQTISIWGNYSTAPSGNRNLISFQNSAQSSAIQMGFRGGNAVAWKWGGTLLADGGPAPSTNTWHYYVYVFDGTTSYIYIDGVLEGSSTEAPQTYKPTEGDIGRYNDGEYLAANLDEPRFSMSPRSAGWIMTEYLNQNDPASFISLGSENNNTLLGTIGVCSSTFPLNQGFPAGGTYSGTGVSGTNFNASAAGVGTHSVTYTYNLYGCSQSGVKTITVTPVPSAPSAANTACCITNIADLSATGTNLKWYSDAGLTVLEGTGSPFATGQTAAGVYTYYVTQTVNGCESTATNVTLTVNNALSILTQPVPVSICSGNNAVFTVVSSDLNISYQWQENGVNITNGGVYSGATTATLTLTNPGTVLSGRTYRCVLTSGCQVTPLNSSGALLTINTNQWTGAAGTNWNNTGNWSCGAIPVQGTEITIPNVANKPVLSTGSAATVKNLTIATGSSLTITGNTIKISGTITNNGTFNVVAGTIEMNGTTAQQIGANLFTTNTIQNLIVNNAAGVTLQGTLNVTRSVLAGNGNFNTGGFLTLVSSATQTAFIDGSGTGQVLGDVTMQRYLPSGFGYRYISSPFLSATVSQLSPEVNLSSGFPLVYRYDENRTSSGWVSYVNPVSVLNPMQGYSANFGSVAAPEILDITGVVNNGPYSATLYNHDRAYTKGMNLVGNPYPSAIDWNAAAGWTRTNIDAAVYFFKPGGADQYGGAYASFVPPNISSDGIVSNIIPSMQGFFVHVSDGAIPVTGTFAMNNSVRVTDVSQSFAKSGTKYEQSLIRVTAAFSTDTSVTDPLLIYTDEKATAAFDSDFDALKLFNTDLTIPNIYSVSPEDLNLSINGLPPSGTSPIRIPLGLKANTAGTVVFRLKTLTGSFAGLKVALFDSVAGITQQLNNNGEYRINLTVADYRNRFFLDINNLTTGTETPETSDRQFLAWVSGGILKAEINYLQGNNGNLFITDLTGRRLMLREISGTGYYEFNMTAKEGVYFVTLTSGSRKTVQKIIIGKR